MRASRAQAKAWSFLMAALCAGTVLAATPPNTPITNTATASFRISGVPVSVSGSSTVTTANGTPASIKMLATADGTPGLPGDIGIIRNVPGTLCRNGAGNWTTLAPPVAPGQGPLVVPANHLLVSARVYAAGDVVLVQVIDLDQNRDPAARDVVTVTIASSGGDSERIQLTETEVSSGIFIGYIQTVAGPAQPGDCALQAGAKQQLTATYVDSSESDTVVSADALIDPFGIVFDTVTGGAVSGARVTIIDTATGLPATVRGNDGVSAFPSTVVTGSTVSDAGGAVYAFAPGRYQFPRLAPGTYRFQVELPPGYRFPSQANDTAIQALAGAPFAIAPGSRGEAFTLIPGPALEIDIPVDPGAIGEVGIVKTAGKATAAIGDFVPYALAIANRGTYPLNDVVIADQLPPGFRYQKGSARLEGQPLPDPQVGADGRSLQFSLGTLAASGSVTVRYVAMITPGARLGEAENTARAAGRITSNVAKATVTVRDDLNRTRAILMGRVMLADACPRDEREAGAVKGLPGVRILLQDGTAVATDGEGNWHIEGVRPGTHVVQIDPATLPAGAELRNCDPSSRTGGRDFSQFVNVRGGSLWRADFRLLQVGGKPVAAPAAAPAANPAAAGAATSTPEAALTLVEKLPYDDKWLAAAAPGNEWLHPRSGFVPALPSVKVAVKHAAGSQVELRVNGAPSDPLGFDGTQTSPSGQLQLSLWRAVHLREGANVLDLTVRDAAGKVLLQERRTLHYAVAPASVAFDAKRSTLVADGRTPPVIAVRMLDRNGQPVRRGIEGEVSVLPPFLPQQLNEALQRDPLTVLPAGRGRYQIGEDGVALVTLQPTMQSGEAVLRFDFGDNRPQEVRAWLQADLRDWVLVGFAEGTAGHKRLSGNMEAADGASDPLFDQNRVAFYAKGRVKGEYLLTVAYDSAKEKGTGQERLLKQAIDPNQYYTLYGDAAQAMYDAASTSKLYLRIEKKQFYALFGDYDTGLTVTELGRYNRTLTGLKSEYKGETFAYTAFAARTSQSFLKDELQGDGTSGLYRLRARGILANSEKVRIEVRDRFQPDRVLSARTLSPYLEYQLDRDRGTLLLREPVPSRDQQLNPVFIVVEYESDDSSEAGLTYGGRAAAKVGKGGEVGVTHLREGNTGREGTLTAADASVQLGEGTRVRAEVATSESTTATGPRSGQAYLVEATHDDGKTAARAYAGAQDPGFGLGQQAGAAGGQRKVGADARHKLTEKLAVQGEAYRQDNLATSGRRDVVEGRAVWTDKESGVALTGGVRAATETDAAGNESQARQLTGGAAYETLGGKLVLRATTDLDVGSSGGNGTVNFPNRLGLGADYRITPETTLTATQEFARGEQLRANTTRVGLRTQLWTGAEALVGGGNQETLDAGRLFASAGLVQKLRFGDHWSADFGIDRTQTLRSAVNPLGPAQPLASGTPPAASYGILTEDYTAVTMGLAYTDAFWSGNARAEWRDGATEDKVNLLLGAQRRLGQGRVVAAAMAFLDAEAADRNTRQLTLRASHAWRPSDSRWAWLQRLDYVEDRNESLGSRLFTRKLIANFNGNLKASPRSQVAFQYSAKYVRELLGETSHSGYTDLWGIEARHDVDERWDIGLHAGMLTSWRTGTRSYQLGLSVGHRLADNTWVSVGYNHLGFTDHDFTGAEYRAQGFYVNLRMKFDQDTFDLNDRKAVLPERKP